MTALAPRPSPFRSNGNRRAARIVFWWAAFYTRDLETHIAADRRDELASDVWEQGAEAEDRGASPIVTEMSILLRAARGVPSDLSWRRQVLSLSRVVVAISRGQFLPSTLAMTSLVIGMVGIGCGIRLLMQPQLRWLAALWLAGASVVVFHFGAVALVTLSATAQALTNPYGPLFVVGMPALSLVGLTLFYIALAIAWIPARTPRPINPDQKVSR